MSVQVLSAIQPTGEMHFGNYFGAIKNWVKLQEEYTCAFGVVDYHAMTLPYNHKKLRNNSWELIMNLIAVGMKPENLFIQSLVPEHTELGWILNCFTSYGQLTRMTQFKDKSNKSTKNPDAFISSGLLNYPVLQAADILIYRPQYVPVGKDQEQHLELTRNIAQRFNTTMKQEYFILPEAIFMPIAKINSTANPTMKMSKSAGEKHYINVFADETKIRKQIRSAVTDTGDVLKDNNMSPGVENLFNLLSAMNKMEQHELLLREYTNGQLKYSDLKDSVAEALIELNQSFRTKKQEIVQNKKDIKSIVKQSSHEKRLIAQQTLHEVKDLCGLLNVKH